MGSKRSGPLVLVAMIFAVSMTFIDQTIVSISIPEIQQHLGLSETGVQWIVSGYLLSMAAVFALGGKLADVLGRRRMLVVGVLIFVVASALCGATPDSGIAEAWIIAFRVIQGAGAAIMFPAALAITISAFPVDKRGRALAIFFGVTGALTSVGPIAGGYLAEWDWRAIFWINIPIAIIALVLIWKSKPDDLKNPQPIDIRGAVLVALGMALSVLGFQQAAIWGWDSPLTWICIVGGILVLVGFYAFENRQKLPLIRVAIMRQRAFAADCLVLFFLSIAFVPLFFFASMYSQIALGWEASESGLYLLVFFGGFMVGSQWGGRILDSKGAKPAVIMGAALGAVGFFLWAGKMTDIDAGLGGQWIFIAMAGAGVGLMLGPVSTDAINRAPNTSYGEATGITQTVRNYAAAFGMAVLGTILTTQSRINVEDKLGALGVPTAEADEISHAMTAGGGGEKDALASHVHGHELEEIFHGLQEAFASSSQTIFYIMAGVMVCCLVIASLMMVSGRMEEVIADPEVPETGPEASG